MDEQKAINIKVQVDTSDVDKSFKDIQKQAQNTSDKVGKESKKMNNEMTRGTQQATDKMAKQFKDLQKQMTKALDTNSMMGKLRNQLSNLRTQIQSSLGNITVNANVNAEQQAIQPNSQSQVDLGGLGGAVATGAIMNSQLAQMHDTLSDISNVEIAEVFEDATPEISEVVKGIDFFKQELEQLYAELGEEFDFSEFNKSFEAQFQSIQQTFDKLSTNKTGKELIELRTQLNNLATELAGVGVESKVVGKLINDIEKATKIRGITRGTDIISDEQIAKMEVAVNQASELRDLVDTGFKRANFLEGIEQDIANLTELQNRLSETGRKAEAIKLGEALNDFAKRAREAGLELNNIGALQETFNSIMNSSSRLTNQQCQAMIQYSDNAIAGLHRIVQAQQTQVNSTNTVVQSQSKMQRIMQGLASSYQTYAPKIQSYIDKIKTKTTQWLSSHNKASKGIQSANKKMASSFKSLLSAMMPFMSIYAIFNGIKTSITNAMDSIETESKFGAVFGSQAQEMSKWINQLNKELGVNTVQMQDWTSSLYSMGTNLGFTSQEAVKFSQDLSMLAQDMSSFYNIDGQDAFNKLKSYMAGSTEVLYEFGVVATEANLQTFALSQGITKSYSSMSQAEKSALRYQFAMQGLSQASGDLANTLKSPSNQTRLLKESLNQLSIALGRCFMPILTVVLPILNTFVQALTATINAVANFISQVFALFGVEMNFGGSGGVTGAVEGMADAISSADVGSGGLSDNLASGAESAKEIQKWLGGIDELNIVTSKQDSGSSGGSGSGSGGSGSGSGVGTVTPSVDSSTMDNALNELETKYSKWAKKVASALSLTWTALKDGWNSVGGYIDSSLESLKTAFSNLGTSIESFLVGAWNNGGEELIYNFGRLSGAIVGLALDISSQVIGAVAQLFEHLNPDNNANTRKFIEAMNNALVACQNFALSAGGWLQTFMDNGGQAFLNNVGDIAFIVGTILVDAFSRGVKLVTDFMNSWLGQAILSTVAKSLEVLSGALETMLGWVRDNQEWIEALLLAIAGGIGTFKLISGAIELFNGVMAICSGIMTALSTAGTILSGVIAFLTSPIGLVVVAIGAVIAIGYLLWDNWDWLCEKASELGEWISNKWTELKDWVVKKVQEMVDGVKQWWSDLVTNTKTKFSDIKTAITTKFSEILTAIKTKAIEIKDAIVNKWTETVTNVKTKVAEVYTSVTTKFSEILTAIKTKVGEIYTAIVNKFTEIKTNVTNKVTEIKTNITNKWTEIKTAIATKMGEIYTSIINKWTEIKTNVTNKVTEIKTSVVNKFTEIKTNVVTKVTELYTSITTKFNDIKTYVTNKATEIKTNIVNKFTEIKTGVVNKVTEISTSISTTWSNIKTNITNKVTEIKTNIVNKWNEIKTSISEKVTSIKTNISTTFSNVLTNVTTTFNNIKSKITTPISNAKSTISTYVSNIKSYLGFSGLSNTVNSVLNTIKGYITNPISSAKSTISTYVSNIKSYLGFSGLSTTVNNALNTVKSKITTPISSAKSTISTYVSNIKSYLSFSGLATTVSTAFNSVKTKISTAMEGAKTVVNNAVSKLKSAFNFSWSLPNLKLPHISVSGGVAPYGIAGKGKLPSFSIKWYRNGGILPAGSNSIFGMNGNALMAGGELSTGGEAILPLSDLFSEMRGMFDTQNRQLISALANNNQPISLSLNIDGQTLAKKQFKSFKELSRLGLIDMSELV